jgi:hypothetical protein
MADEDCPRLARELLSYYTKHPQAADTSEGLARWRLLEEFVERTTYETEEALGWLVQQGFLREMPTQAGRSVFVLDQDRRRDAEALLGGPMGAKRGRR